MSHPPRICGEIDLERLNSLTKYPSIPTYHPLGERGVLQDLDPIDFGAGEVVATEKLDGTNARIVFDPSWDYLVGSREAWLHARGDRVWNPAEGIVEAVRPVAERVRGSWWRTDRWLALYGEVYGGKVGKNAKEYTRTGRVGFRLFDAAWWTDEDVVQAQGLGLDQIAAARERGGQHFYSVEEREKLLNDVGVSWVPFRTSFPGADLPRSVKTTFEWMERGLLRWTRAGLDPLEGGATDSAAITGQSEGVVVRTPDRRVIAKLRFEDYARTLRSKFTVTSGSTAT